jgi:hypothetical protein
LRPGKYRLTKSLRALGSDGVPVPKAVGEIIIRSEFVVGTREDSGQVTDGR